MKKKLLFSILATILLAYQCYAEENFFKSDVDLEVWYSGYYLSPTPQRVVDAILYYGQSSMYQKMTSRDQLAIFIATIIERNPDIMQSAYQKLTISGNENSKIFFLNILWFMDTPASKDLIQKAEIDWSTLDIIETGEWLLSNPTFDVLNEPITNAHHLDLLWSIFLATGDETPVKRVISALKFLDTKDAGLVLIGGAAQWSLKSSAELHPKIMEICKQEIKTARGTTRRALGEILAQR